MIEKNLAMYDITVGESDDYRIPYFGYRGTPTGVDVFKVLETGIVPVIDAGLAGRNGVGQIGAGTLRAPIECFRAARGRLPESVRDLKRPPCERERSRVRLDYGTRTRFERCSGAGPEASNRVSAVSLGRRQSASGLGSAARLPRAPALQQPVEALRLVVHHVVGGVAEEVELGPGDALQQLESPGHRHRGVVLGPDQEHRMDSASRWGEDVLLLEPHVGVVVGFLGRNLPEHALLADLERTAVVLPENRLEARVRGPAEGCALVRTKSSSVSNREGSL